MGASLSAFLRAHRDEVLRRAARKIRESSTRAARRGDELTRDLPQCLEGLIAALLDGVAGARRGDVAAEHGRRRYRLGFEIGDVVHDYGSLCDAIAEVALAEQQPITVREVQLLNQALDGGIAMAVSEFERERELDTRAEHTSHLGFIVHELRNALATAVLSFEMIGRGTVPIAGRTAAVLRRCHARMDGLIGKLVAGVRADAGALRRQRLSLAHLLDEVAATTELEARQRAIDLAVDVDDRVWVDGDRELLLSAVTNLAQNGVKFTRAGGRLELRGFAVDSRALIEVEDECGGLPDAANDALFMPFVQEGQDRSGLGLGLAITRDAVERHGGTVALRNLPGKGCVFTIDLPRAD
jgi:signal transduction histidine kinase